MPKGAAPSRRSLKDGRHAPAGPEHQATLKRSPATFSCVTAHDLPWFTFLHRLQHRLAGLFAPVILHRSQP
jgi:hypothetical protein